MSEGGKGGGTEWMYNQGQGVDQEDYLLGKAIGKNFDTEGTMGQINAVEYDCAPPSIFASTAGHQVDLQRKLLEDPLVAIKKRELEDRKRLLDNPLKMKALREHIETLKKSKKEKKKKKKKKKNRGSDSDSDTDLDLALLQRLEKIEGREAEQDRRRIQEEEEKEKQAYPKEKEYTDKEALDSPPREDRRNRNKPRDDHDLKRSRQRSDSREMPSYRRRRDDSPPVSSYRRRSRDRSPPPPRRRSRSRERRNSPSARRNRSRSREAQKRQRSRSREEQRRQRSRSREIQKRQRSRSREEQRRRKSRSRSPQQPTRRRSRSADNGRQKKSDKKTSGADKSKSDADKEAERARKLAEMMENANWREEQRANKVKSYRKEVEEESKLTEHDPEFLRRELRKAAANSSVESRIRSNKHNIQRGVGVMDSNFARR